MMKYRTTVSLNNKLLYCNRRLAAAAGELAQLSRERLANRFPRYEPETPLRRVHGIIIIVVLLCVVADEAIGDVKKIK